MRVIKKIDIEENRERIRKFYIDNGIRSEIPKEVAVMMDDGEWIAVSGRTNSLLSGFAIKEEMRGEGILDSLLSFWIKESFYEIDTLYVFTKREYSDKFQSGGFKELAHTDTSAFLIRSSKSIADLYCNPEIREGVKGCVVMHANPFTKGHLYLIEEALKEVDFLYIFLLSNDERLPYELRLKMIEKSIDFHNAKVISGGDLIISRETFPSYFLKDDALIDSEHASIDALVFKNHIAPLFGISKRFLGEEPLDPSTEIYNKTLKEILSPEIELRIIPRKSISGNIISATKVRKAFLEGDEDLFREMLPKGTLQIINDNREEVRRCWKS